jgi:hypothetical protein
VCPGFDCSKACPQGQACTPNQSGVSTCQTTQPVPALPAAGLAGLVAALGAVGAYVSRRRARS